MKNKVLKLAKRLDNFIIEDIEPILNCNDLEDILTELVEEKSLEFNNGKYFYIKKYTQKKDLPNFFQYHAHEEIELIIKCFCADVPALKTTLLIESSKNVVSNFYKYFRDVIYDKQLTELKKYFSAKPKSPAVRTIYDKKVYLYFYEGQVFVADKMLKTNNIINKHPEVEMREIRNSYYKVRRYFLNYSLQKVLPEVVAERLWRRKKDYNELIFELNEFCK